MKTIDLVKQLGWSDDLIKFYKDAFTSYGDVDFADVGLEKGNDVTFTETHVHLDAPILVSATNVSGISCEP